MKNGLFFNLKMRDRIGLAAVVATCAIFLILRFDEFPVGAGMDDAYYIEMARSLAAGRGPVIHLNDIVPAWRPDIFPVGFPLLLSPLVVLAATSVQIFKIVPLLALTTLIPVCLLLTRSAAGRARLALTALVCLNPWTIGFSTRVFSDLPFAAVSLAAVVLFLDLAEAPRTGRFRFAVLVLVSAAAIMIRSIGLALPAAMVAYWLMHRRWRQALFLGGGLIAALLPHAVVSRAAGGGLITRGYLNQVFAGDGTLGSRFALVFENLIGYLHELPVVMLPVFGNPLENLAGRAGLGTVYGPLQLTLGCVLVGAIVWGHVVIGKRDTGRARFLGIYLAVYCGVLLNFSGYPSGVQPRLLLPILPLLFLVLLEVFDQVAGARRDRLFWPAVLLLLSLSLVHNGYRAVHPLSSAQDEAGKVFKNPGLGADWIRDNTRGEDLVMVRWPLRQHIHFLRPVVGFGAVGRKELDERIDRFGVDFIFLGPGQPDEATTSMLAILEADPGRFDPVHQDAGAEVMIFRVAKVP